MKTHHPHVNQTRKTLYLRKEHQITKRSLSFIQLTTTSVAFQGLFHPDSKTWNISVVKLSGKIFTRKLRIKVTFVPFFFCLSVRGLLMPSYNVRPLWRSWRSSIPVGDRPTAAAASPTTNQTNWTISIANRCFSREKSPEATWLCAVAVVCVVGRRWNTNKWK